MSNVYFSNFSSVTGKHDFNSDVYKNGDLAFHTGLLLPSNNIYRY